MLQGGKFLICWSKSRWQASEVIWHRVTYFWSSWKQSWESKENRLKIADMVQIYVIETWHSPMNWLSQAGNAIDAEDMRDEADFNWILISLLSSWITRTRLRDKNMLHHCIMLHPIHWQEVEDCLAGNLEEERFSDLFRSWYRVL